MSFQNTFIGTVSGILAGMAVGLLVAPAKGSETRQKITDFPKTVKKKIQTITGQAAMELEDLEEIFSNEIGGLKDDVRETILKLIEAAKDSYDNVKNEAASNSNSYNEGFAN